MSHITKTVILRMVYFARDSTLGCFHINIKWLRFGLCEHSHHSCGGLSSSYYAFSLVRTLLTCLTVCLCTCPDVHHDWKCHRMAQDAQGKNSDNTL